jgi:hypothetical protein
LLANIDNEGTAPRLAGLLLASGWPEDNPECDKDKQWRGNCINSYNNEIQ